MTEIVKVRDRDDIIEITYDDLLKIPGIGIKSANKIIKSRKLFSLTFNDLKKLGVVLKRAKYFKRKNKTNQNQTQVF